MDTIDKQTRSRIMASVKSSGNRSTEKRLRSALIRAKIRGWRIQVRELPGTPDFVFDKEHLIVFVDGCFWHDCPHCYRRPSTTRKYWDDKVQRNMARDKRVKAKLRREGWSVIRIWEHELLNLAQVINRIQHNLSTD